MLFNFWLVNLISNYRSPAIISNPGAYSKILGCGNRAFHARGEEAVQIKMEICHNNLRI